MLKAKNKAVLLIAGLAIAAVVLILVTKGNRNGQVSIATIHPVRQSLSTWIVTNGKLEPVAPQVIQARWTTFIDAVLVTEGQALKRGQVLMKLNADDLKGELAQAREQLAAAEDAQRIAANGGSPDEAAQIESDQAKSNAEITRLSHEVDTLQRLYAKQAATSAELEQNRTALQKAEADRRMIEEKKEALANRSKDEAARSALLVEQARISIASLEQKLKLADVTAPVDGTLYALPVHARTLVHTGDVIAEMADLRQIRVRIFIDEPDLGSLQIGQPVEITWDALPNRVWNGRVEQLPETVVARGTRSVGELLCSVDNEDGRLLPNTNVDVRIRTAERKNVLIVARGAVRTEGGKHYVFVADHGYLRSQQVDVGLANATDYEILNGLRESDTVALSGSEPLRDGLRVAGND